MNPTAIFPDTPATTDAHRRDLAFGNYQHFREWIKTPRTPVTLKRAILVELEHRKTGYRTEILHRLIVALQKAERREIEKNIKKHLKTSRL